MVQARYGEDTDVLAEVPTLRCLRRPDTSPTPNADLNFCQILLMCMALNQKGVPDLCEPWIPTGGKYSRSTATLQSGDNRAGHKKLNCR